VAVGIAQLHAVDADVQEAAHVHGADAEVALDGVAGLAHDELRHLGGAAPGVQPDDGGDDAEDEERQQREQGDACHTGGLAPARPRRGRRLQAAARRLDHRLWRVLGHFRRSVVMKRAPRTSKGLAERQMEGEA